MIRVTWDCDAACLNDNSTPFSAGVGQGGGSFSAATRELFALQAFPNFPDW
jgi:hypothetical protein